MSDGDINKLMSAEEQQQVEEEVDSFAAAFASAVPGSQLQKFERAILRTYVLWSIRRHGKV